MDDGNEALVVIRNDFENPRHVEKQHQNLRAPPLPFDHFQDLHAFDGIDAQIGFQIEIEIEHLGRISGAIADDMEKLRC